MNQPEVETAYLGRKPTAEPVQQTAIRSARSLAAATILKLKNVVAGYEGSSVLRDVNLEVAEGEIVALLGRTASAKPPRCVPSWERKAHGGHDRV